MEEVWWVSEAGGKKGTMNGVLVPIGEGRNDPELTRVIMVLFSTSFSIDLLR